MTPYYLGIDIGNTHTVIGLFKGAKILHTWRLATRKDATCHEIAPTLAFLLEQKGVSLSDLSGVLLSSVVPPASDLWWQLSSQYLKVECRNAHTICEDIIQISYPRPHEIGTDRLVNSIGAYNRFKASCIVVDFGTATTFDCISQNGEYLGGAIAPGVAMSLHGLFSKTSRLPLVRLSSEEVPALAKSTEEAIKAGILYGFAGMTDRLIKELSAHFNDPPITVATGGLASTIFGLSEHLHELAPDLTMEGLGACIRASFMEGK